MKNINLKIIIKKNYVNGEGNTISTVGMSFEDPVQRAVVGDYEKFDGAELTNEQISGAVQRLLMKLLPMVPDVEEHISVAPVEVVIPTKGKKHHKFKRNEDGTFSLA